MTAFITSDKRRDLGILVLRLTLGAFFIYYGSGKMFNPAKWSWLGSQMPFMNWDTLAPFWGFMAAFSEFFGGILLILGFLTRPACVLMMLTMLVATYYHAFVDKWSSLPLLYALLFLVLLLVGPDRFSLDKKLCTK